MQYPTQCHHPLAWDACVSSAPHRPSRTSLLNMMVMLVPSEAAASCFVPDWATKYRFTVDSTTASSHHGVLRPKGPGMRHQHSRLATVRHCLAYHLCRRG